MYRRLTEWEQLERIGRDDHHKLPGRIYKHDPEQGYGFIYVDSSYGQKGLEDRVVNSQQNPKYRAENPTDRDACMELPGAVANFSCLVNFASLRSRH